MYRGTRLWFMLIANPCSLVPGCKFFVIAGGHYNGSDGTSSPFIKSKSHNRSFNALILTVSFVRRSELRNAPVEMRASEKAPDATSEAHQ